VFTVGIEPLYRSMVGEALLSDFSGKLHNQLGRPVTLKGCMDLLTCLSEEVVGNFLGQQQIDSGRADLELLFLIRWKESCRDLANALEFRSDLRVLAIPDYSNASVIGRAEPEQICAVSLLFKLSGLRELLVVDIGKEGEFAECGVDQVGHVAFDLRKQTGVRIFRIVCGLLSGVRERSPVHGTYSMSLVVLFRVRCAGFPP